MPRFMLGLFFALVLALGFSVATSAQNINCDSFTFQEDAQADSDSNGDANGLDGPPGPATSGVPGLACENLPSRGNAAPAPAALAPAAEVPVAAEAPAEAPVAAPAAPVTSVPSTGTGSASIGATGPALALLVLAGSFGLAGFRARKAA